MYISVGLCRVSHTVTWLIVIVDDEALSLSVRHCTFRVWPSPLNFRPWNGIVIELYVLCVICKPNLNFL